MKSSVDIDMTIVRIIRSVMTSATGLSTSSGTTSSSKMSASGSGRRRVRDVCCCDGGRGSDLPKSALTEDIPYPHRITDNSRSIQTVLFFEAEDLLVVSCFLSRRPPRRWLFARLLQAQNEGSQIIARGEFNDEKADYGESN